MRLLAKRLQCCRHNDKIQVAADTAVAIHRRNAVHPDLSRPRVRNAYTCRGSGELGQVKISDCPGVPTGPQSADWRCVRAVTTLPANVELLRCEGWQRRRSELVSKKVGILRGLSSDLACHRPNERDSEKTVDFSARKSRVTKRVAISGGVGGRQNWVFFFGKGPRKRLRILGPK